MHTECVHVKDLAIFEPWSNSKMLCTMQINCLKSQQKKRQLKTTIPALDPSLILTYHSDTQGGAKKNVLKFGLQ